MLEFGLKWVPYDKNTQPTTNPHHQGGFKIEPRIDAAATRAPAASKEDSHPQAILKFHHPSSLDRACHGLSVRQSFESCFALLATTK